MSWSETHRYYQVLRAIEAELDRTRDGVVPWRPEYAAVFGTPQRLRLALRRRWVMLVEAQVDLAFERDGRPGRQLRTVARGHQGLLRAVVADEPRWRALIDDRSRALVGTRA